MKDWLAGLWNILLEAVFVRPTETSNYFAVFGVAGAAAFICGFLLIGIPGAVFMELMRYLLTRAGMTLAPSNEATWGVAIMISLALPLALPLAHWLTSFGLPRSLWLLLTVCAGWALLLGGLGVISPAK